MTITLVQHYDLAWIIIGIAVLLCMSGSEILYAIVTTRRDRRLANKYRHMTRYSFMSVKEK